MNEEEAENTEITDSECWNNGKKVLGILFFAHHSIIPFFSILCVLCELCG